MEDHTVSSFISLIDIVSEKMTVNSNCSVANRRKLGRGGGGKGNNGGKCLLVPNIFFI